MRTTRIRLAVVISILLAGAAADAQVAQPTPLPGTYVHDFAGVIADDREAEIQAKARRLKDEHRTEIAVVTIDSLQGEESFAYSMRMARSWGIGSPEGDVRGLLILVAVKDRKTAFRTSRHIEGELPDGVTGEISRAMNAYFKQGDFGGGLSAGVDKIIARLKEVGEPLPVAAAAPAPGFRLGWLWLPVVGAPVLGLGYAALRRRGKKRREAAAARSPSGFRAWASKVDPTPVPKTKYKSQDITRAGSHTARNKKKKSSTRSNYQAPSYYESSGSSSSSSGHDSSSSGYDSSSSSSDSGSSYSGGSDFGGGGSDSSW
jgi:uncharacterized membrane protein YgcG